MFSIRCLLFVSALTGLLNQSECGRILAFFPVPSISHQIVFRVLMQELSERGHQVTVITPDPVKNPNKNLTQIDLHDISYEIMSKKLYDHVFTQNIPEFFKTLREIYDVQLGSPEVKNLLQDETLEFDLCFVESMGVSMVPIKDKFKCPLISISSFTPSYYAWESLGNPTNPVFYPGSVAKDVPPFNFFERIKTVAFDLAFRYYVSFVNFKEYNKIAKKHFGPDMRDIEEIMEDTDMLFVNAHPIFAVRPVLPSVVYMGSMHIQQKNNPLPQHLQTLMDSSTNGVVYFSLGSNVQSRFISPEKRKIILDTFAEIPYTIIWKWENETLTDKTGNLHTFKWLPQQDLLAHPNVKLFITQGGQQSIEEAIHHRVPLVCMPVFSDQYKNAQTIVKHKLGKRIDFDSLNKEDFKNVIMEVINDKQYKENIIEMKDLLNDQPQTSLERSVWWTEYVLRHKGAKHLRSPAAGQPFYVYFLLDVFLFFSVIGGVVVYSIYKLLVFLRNIKFGTIGKTKKE